MNKKILAVVLVFSLCFATFLISHYWLEHKELAMSVDLHLTVGNVLGLNTDTDAIWFGTVSRGNTGMKHINIAAGKTGVYVIKIQGEPLDDWISVSKNNILLETGENKSISISVTVPMNAEFGDYNGTLEVYFRKV